MQQNEKLKLSNLCQGGAEEIFQRDLDKVLENIADPNTPAEATRKITLEIELKPGSDRRSAIATFKSSTKLRGVSAVRSTVYIQRASDGSIDAYPQDPNQGVMFMPQSSDAKQ